MTERISLLDLPIDPLDLDGLLNAVEALVVEGRARPGRRVAYLNVHVVNQARRHSDLAAFLRGADLCYCDGAGVALGAKIMGAALPGRMTGADWIWDLAARAEGRLKIFWLGGAPGVTDRACAVLRGRHPALEMASDHGYHPPEDTPALIERVNAFAPDIVLVGMGTPVQERWVARWGGDLQAPVVWCLGATADFIAGETNRGPAWLHANAEWLARLITEPRRLWRRYLIGNSVFLARVLVARARDRAR